MGPSNHALWWLDTFLCQNRHDWEWWYYCGHLRDAGGEELGFALALFRKYTVLITDSKLVVGDVFIANSSLTFVKDAAFEFESRSSTSLSNEAGVDEDAGRIWNGTWIVHLPTFAMGVHTLLADTKGKQLELQLTPMKPPVNYGAGRFTKNPHGEDVSIYSSFTRLEAKGILRSDTSESALRGLAWMDHECFDLPAEVRFPSWDWFSAHLTDGTDLMIYGLRHSTNMSGPFVQGTLISPEGHQTEICSDDIRLEPYEWWLSPHSGGRYPVRWIIRIASQAMHLDVSPVLSDQEVAGSASGGSISYWEGLVELVGSKQGVELRGIGHLEMTGYAGAAY